MDSDPQHVSYIEVIVCPDITITQDAAVNSSIETQRIWTIDGDLEYFIPSYDIPNTCPTSVTAELTLANGDPLPSFIDLYRKKV